MGINIGFIGVGNIASALVTGFCSAQDIDHRIYLSPRNAKKASALADRFENVTVARSNQEVLDKSEWVVLAMVPKFGEEILRRLSFREDHRVINLMADCKLPEIAEWIGKTRKLIHMIPLPFVSRRIGPIAIYPDDKDVEDIFSPLGAIVGVDDEKKIQALLSITALMSPYYVLLREIVKWGEVAGLSKKESIYYTTAFFEALSFQGRYAKDGDIGLLSREVTTGGLNEMALSFIRRHSGFEPWTMALDPVLERLKKKGGFRLDKDSHSESECSLVRGGDIL